MGGSTAGSIALSPAGLSWMVAALVALSVALFAAGLRARRLEAETVEERVRRYAQPRTVAEIELSEPLSERVFKPLVRNSLRLLGRLAPRQNIAELERNLAQAGSPLGFTVIDFLGARLLVAVVFGLLAGGVALFARSSIRLAMFSAPVGGLLGFFAPMLWLRMRIGTRQREIERTLPDCLDMLVVSLDAGLGFDAAVLKVAQRWRHELARELEQMEYEIRAGKPRTEALQDLVARTGAEDVATFVAVILQADQFGVSVAKALHIHAEQMRVLRRYRAEELARQATLKMLFPLVFMIFPALLAVVLGPAVPELLQSLASLGG